MQEGESDALVKLRRGVNIYDGSADHDGRLWHRFKNQLATALAGWGSRRVKLLVYDEQQALTAANVENECKLMFADMRDGLHGGSEKTVATLWGENYVWEVEYVQQSIDKVKKEIFRWYLQIFDGTCKTKIETYGPERVNEIYNEFDKSYGKSTKKDLHGR